MSPVYKNNPDFYRHHMDIEEARERNSAPAFEIRAELYVYCICSTLDNLAGSCSAGVHTLHTYYSREGGEGGGTKEDIGIP